MGLLFKILGSLGLLVFIAVVPNLRDTKSLTNDFLPMGVSILMLGVGLILERLDRLLASTKPGDSKPTA